MTRFSFANQFFCYVYVLVEVSILGEGGFLHAWLGDTLLGDGPLSLGLTSTGVGVVVLGTLHPRSSELGGRLYGCLKAIVLELYEVGASSKIDVLVYESRGTCVYRSRDRGTEYYGTCGGC